MPREIHLLRSGPVAPGTRRTCPCCTASLPGTTPMCAADTRRVPAAVWAKGLDAAVTHVNMLNARKRGAAR